MLWWKEWHLQVQCKKSPGYVFLTCVCAWFLLYKYDSKMAVHLVTKMATSIHLHVANTCLRRLQAISNLFGHYRLQMAAHRDSFCLESRVEWTADLSRASSYAGTMALKWPCHVVVGHCTELRRGKAHHKPQSFHQHSSHRHQHHPPNRTVTKVPLELCFNPGRTSGAAKDPQQLPRQSPKRWPLYS